MTSLFSNTMSPIKDGTSSLPRRQTSFAKPPLRALYDLLIAPMEGVSASPQHGVSSCQNIPFPGLCPSCVPLRYTHALLRQPDVFQNTSLLCPVSQCACES